MTDAVTPADRELLAVAMRVRENAYAPYSGFRVGAAVRTDKGVFEGVNLENAAYPLTVCAERNAIGAAVAAGARRIDVVAVVADTEAPVSPCGGCRQVIFEMGPHARLVLGSTRGPTRITSIGTLLPEAFGPSTAPLGATGSGGAAPDPATPRETEAAPEAAAALSGVRVVDLTRILAGPFATQRLADLGAEVWKIENPNGGDDTRGWGPPFQEGVSTYFLAVNRNKQSVALNLKHEGGREVLWRLLEQADILIENFRPGTLARLGFSWEAVRERCPRLVYCSISGYGHDSRYRDRASYDVVIQGESGVMDVTGHPDGPPTKCGLSIADVVAGMNAVDGILAALHRRGRTGAGGRVDIALFDGMLSLLTYQGQMQLSCGKAPVRMGNAHPSIVPYETFRTRDGHLNLGVASESLWARFCQLVNRPGWQTDERFARNRDRVVHREVLKPLIEQLLLEETSDTWYERLEKAGIPCGRVNRVPTALEVAAQDERGLILELEHPQAGRLRMVGNPVRLCGAQPPLKPPPALGEHTDEVLGSVAGLPAEELARLREAGAIA